MAGKGKGGRDDDDIRVALKLPRRGSLQNREVSLAAQALRKVMTTSSRKGRGGGKSRSGAGVGSGRASTPSSPGAAGAPAARSASHQRVAVRWSYSSNKGDGQWGAHGRYLERDSAQERDIPLEEIEKELNGPLPGDVELAVVNEKEPINGRTRESDEPYLAADRSGNTVVNSPLRESDVAQFAQGEPTISLHSVRSLSSLHVVRNQGRSDQLLPGHANTDMEQGNPAVADGVRRGSDREPRASGTDRSGSRQKGKSRVKPFGSEGVDASISDTLSAWQTGKDEHVFKMIVSPEFGHRMDLREHVREMMKGMEKDLGTRLQWIAIDHHNTDNPHVHVAIRGVDDKGRKLEIDPAYIKDGSRKLAEEVATRQLGFRTERDVADGLERQISQQRFTDLDRTLIKRANNQRIDFDTVIPKSPQAREARLRLIRRLGELTKMGLATRVDSHAWTISVDIEPALRARQVSEDRLKTKFLHRETISDTRAQMVTTELRSLGQRVAGKLVGTGLNDKNSRPYMLIEGFDGKIHFINQSPKVERMRGTGDLRVGNFVALEVVARRDGDGKATGTYTKVHSYGAQITTELLDKEMMASGRPFERPVTAHTVSGAFRSAAAERQAQLLAVGAIAVREDRIVPASREAYDKVRFADAGLTAPDYSYSGPMLSTVVARGQKSVVLEDLKGARHTVSAERLATMGMSFKFVTPGGTMFVGKDDKLGTIALGVRVEKLAEIASEARINRLDTIARQLPDLPSAHPLAAVVAERAKTWRDRGINIQAVDFVRDAAAWTKNRELAASADLQTMVDSPRLNRLDWLMQQAFAPASAPLAKAIDERADVWLKRGVDPRDSRFSILAAVWRKGDELRQAVEEKGMENVLNELGREKGKPTREMPCEPGKQISGRVLVVSKHSDHTAVVIDTGGELTLVRQPLSQNDDIRAGMRVRARAELLSVDTANSQRLAMWRFADLEREQALSKGRKQGRSQF